MISLQEVFDANRKWFFEEKHGQAINESGTCVYWGDNGNCRCAIGCALPPEVAESLSSTVKAVDAVPGLNAHFHMENMEALRNLQSVHDGSSCKNFHADYRPRLIAWAKENNLTLPPDWQ